MGQMCLAFEMLDRSLYDLLHERHWRPLSLREIRPIAKQLLVALDALKGLGILHTDIKPDNVMFVNVQNQSLRVKLIDFGGAIPASKVQPGEVLQPTGYRAPEVTLGLPITEAIDVWGLGCVLAFLYLADNLFPVNCVYQMMKSMVEILGQLEEQLLCAGVYTRNFFSEEKAADGLTWFCFQIYPKRGAEEFEDRRAFVHLMTQLLHLDGDQRISPRKALRHPFITMSHLIKQPDSKIYLTTSRLMMIIKSAEGSAHRVNPCAAPAVRAKATVSFDSSPSSGSSDGVSNRYFYDKYPIFWCFNVGLCFWCCDEDPEAWSSSEAEPKDFIVSASCSHTKTHSVKKRTARFFSQLRANFCCCWDPTAEP
ncbi:homeodomain-interacting protein kinase 2-like [Mastacembelus armatus]|uniref:homeodomain-interacting protein kinase 2-like n=1 Tax=Mastacembelus armatus TaxID=205130 RepID=UPI001436C9BA|nr:homeodomain-interacting protein kinase 2-like [Mastacembelus armatus]